jgi:hypothetical protein
VRHTNPKFASTTSRSRSASRGAAGRGLGQGAGINLLQRPLWARLILRQLRAEIPLVTSSIASGATLKWAVQEQLSLIGTKRVAPRSQRG